METKEFYIPCDGIKVHAKLDMPEDYSEGASCPVVLVIHGLTGHMEERHIKAVARTLNELGCVTLRAEMYGHGKTEGHFEDHTLFKWLTCAMAAAEYIKTLDFVTDVYIAGHSQGGLTSMLMAGMYPELFKAAVFLSPASMMPGGARSGELFGIDFDPENVPDKIYVSPTEWVRSGYIRAAQLIDLDAAIERYKKPVLIVHGDEDEGIPDMYSRKLAGKYHDARLVIVNGEDHCYNYHLDQVLDAIRDFMTPIIAL